MGMVIGIDLGTTNSVVSVKQIKASVLRNAEGDEITPSCVTAVPDSQEGGFDLLVGKSALFLMKQYPDQTVTSIKRLIGREFEDLEVQSLLAQHRLSYAIKTDPSEPGSISVPLGGKDRTPEEISSLILKKLVRDANAAAGTPVEAAVVTVPAYFSDRQKFATRAACEMAGLRLLRLLPEPTAAAISFGLEEGKESSQTILVLDLGGGTFDIAVLNISQGIFMEVAKGGDMWLGGDNIDHLLTDFVFKKIEEQEKCGPIQELVELLPAADRARFRAEIKEKCEAAKIRLSSSPSAIIELFGVLRDKSGRLVDIEVEVKREELERIIAPITQRVSESTAQLLREIRFEKELIDRVLMVGGSSLVPAIQNEVRAMFGDDKVLIHPRPMLAIAEGAALMAVHLTAAERSNLTAMHSVAHDYYIQLVGGQRHLLVARNTPLPFAIEEEFRFAADDQLLARLRIVNEVDGLIESVGELWFHADPTLLEKNQRERIKLSFAIDEDNIISLEATSLTNSRRKFAAQIARGGLVNKLYGDLERTLSSVISKSRSATSEFDALRMSATVVDNILDVADPRTGETRSEKKQLVQKQIANIEGLISKFETPISRLRFAEIALKVAAPVLTSERTTELKEIVRGLERALANLDDLNGSVALLERLDRYLDDVPQASILARSQNWLENLGSSEDAEKMRRRMQEYIEACRSKDSACMEDAKESIYTIATRNFSFDYTPTRRFDRDISL